METIQDTFSTGQQAIAVLFVDENNHSHLTPACEHVTGETTVVTNMEDRGGFVCPCIPIPTNYEFAQENNKIQQTAKNPEKNPQAKGELPQWPNDLPQATLNNVESVNTWLLSVDRKLNANDINSIPSLKRFATDYVMDEQNHKLADGSTNEFLVSVANACARYTISPNQAKGVLNWWRAQAQYANKNKAKTVTPEPTVKSTGVNLTGLPSGMYAVPNGNTRLKVAINSPDSGKWKGWVFVNDGAAYGAQTKYGSQRPGQDYKGQIVNELQTIVDNPVEAMRAYGKLTGTCGRCRRPLEDEESVAYGIGPVCRTKL